MDWSTVTGDGFCRLSTATPQSVLDAWAALAPGTSMDITAYTVGYNIELLRGLVVNAAAHGVSFNFTVAVARAPKGVDARKWALGAGGFDMVLSSTQLTPDRVSSMDFLTPSIPFGYTVVTTKPEVQRPPFSERATTFLQPFTAGVWGCIGGMIVVTGVVFWMLEGHTNEDDFPPAAPEAAAFIPPLPWNLFSGVYRGFTTFFALDIIRATTVSGRIYVMCFAFTSLLLGQPRQTITSVNDFIRYSLPACLRNSTQALAFAARKYPTIRTLIVDDSQEAFLDAVLQGTYVVRRVLLYGRCIGGINTDLHTRYTLATDERFCGLQIVGQLLSFGYYAIPLRKAVPTAASASPSPSTSNPLVTALSVLLAEFIESGGAGEAVTLHFPTDTEAMCNAAADAARWASAGEAASDGLVSINVVDVCGLFILQAAALVLALAVFGCSWVHMRARGRRQVGADGGGDEGSPVAGGDAAAGASAGVAVGGSKAAYVEDVSTTGPPAVVASAGGGKGIESSGSGKAAASSGWVEGGGAGNGGGADGDGDSSHDSGSEVREPSRLDAQR
ncbi:hypothetical protein HYH03_005964 [Edaphochlamys debaryana]|uniref:Ionotropic glutamate receptor C-terminal domain-containing protein n=1 Tax=Edaphochlamys debaryana TaxID=47281 RepID=A0A835Y793_9CHLO|nr:hypothetical protein HYH03_005964 [Edaphochlamys debaryana]|eukprot:KAG2496043.1 hypothetical protein HYH03_005964 [Edaphochlamys debaryana]